MSVCCAYCGAEQDMTRDHLIPRTYSQNHSFRSTPTNPIVWACRECNSTLNDQIFQTFAARLAYVKACHRKRYKKELAFPEWTEVELSTMSANFQLVIKQRLIRAQEARQRLKYMDEVEIGLREVKMTNSDHSEIELPLDELAIASCQATTAAKDPIREEDKALRATAYALGRKRYDTVWPCKRGHLVRYSLTGGCVECTLLNNKKYKK